MQELKLEGLGHELLTEWGRWVRDDSEGRASWSVKPRVDPGFHGEFPASVQIVDKIVAQHKKSGYWGVVARYYLSDLATWEIARGKGWPELRVLTMLVAFSGLVEREYRDAYADSLALQ